MATLRRVKKPAITHDEMRQIWVRALAGDPDAVQLMNYWHERMPEWGPKFDDFNQKRRLVSRPKRTKPIGGSPKPATPWTRAKERVLNAGVSAHQVGGGLPSLGKRR